jgi:hypothetical protein
MKARPGILQRFSLLMLERLNVVIDESVARSFGLWDPVSSYKSSASSHSQVDRDFFRMLKSRVHTA